MKYTFKQFQEEYPDNQACMDKLLALRLGKEHFCPCCGAETVFKPVKNRKCYRCIHCAYQFYPMAGTIFEKSQTPLLYWFYVIFLMTSSRNAISSKEVQRILGVSYKTAWKMTHSIRDLMSEDSNGILSGKVQVDESYVGGLNKNRHKDKKAARAQGRSYKDKTPVFGMAEENGLVQAYVVPNVKIKTLTSMIRKYVAPNSIIVSDEWHGYNKVKHFYDHRVIYHSRKQYSDGENTTNVIEGFWAHMKRMIKGSHIWVSKKHLQKYVYESVFRYNNGKNDNPMFETVINLLSFYPLRPS